ncbi:chemotaxis protein CheV [Acidaminobacter sp. JC074]|uniref:chemotaxis protein n=1 Tax=Acidaminobacter sp. JC074 TaxID=2530199 RepID=UPI001F0E5AB5|nr:chemotaxis protein [Acidaminobacter sp. JC074]MCH4890375.1 chemotaxis protein CheV [Acidaminobacter sp. JC074]
METNILLESGTNEVEILRFKVAGETYAINVVKVSELLHIDNIAKVPNADVAVPGVSLIRGEVITVIDMLQVLEGRKNADIAKAMTLVCEFNQLKVAFAIEEVLGISRITWADIQKPNDITNTSLVIGNINYKDEIVMLLDFEKIVMDISPQSGINLERVENVAFKDRTKYKVVSADDSPMIRDVIQKTLSKAGFGNIRFFNDGLETYNYIMDLYNEYGPDFKNHIDLLITDIEMPQLDGHTLTRRLKEHSVLQDLPVVIFSSLITDELRHKGESVGADAQMSKPQIDQLVKIVDELLEG